jgi:SnoaL-like polyketide cyclase
MATYGESPVVVLNGQRIEGRAAIREFHRSFGFGGDGSFSEVHVAERARHRAADAIVVEQTLSGVQTGTWMQKPATGRRFEVQVCTVYLFDDRGRLAAEHVYFDGAWLARQLTR